MALLTSPRAMLPGSAPQQHHWLGQQQQPPPPVLQQQQQTVGRRDRFDGRAPIGIEHVAPGADSEVVTDVLFAMGAMGGEAGVRHIQVSPVGDICYACIALGYPTPISMDQVLSLMYMEDGKRRTHIYRVYINPCFPVSNLTQWVPAKEGESRLMPALVVEVSTERWRTKSTTKMVVPPHAHGNSGNRIGMVLFPHLATGASVVSPLNGHASTQQQLETRIAAGTLSPGQRLLPLITLPYVSTAPQDDDPPMPMPETSEELTAHARRQLEMAFRLLFRVHRNRSDLRTNDSALPLEPVLERLELSPLRYRCMAHGFMNLISANDMMRLYLSEAPLKVQQVAFDMNAMPASDHAVPGALYLDVLIQQAPRENGPVVERFVPAPPPPEAPPAPSRKRPLDPEPPAPETPAVVSSEQAKRAKPAPVATEAAEADEAPIQPPPPPPPPAASTMTFGMRLLERFTSWL